MASIPPTAPCQDNQPKSIDSNPLLQLLDEMEKIPVAASCLDVQSKTPTGMNSLS